MGVVSAGAGSVREGVEEEEGEQPQQPQQAKVPKAKRQKHGGKKGKGAQPVTGVRVSPSKCGIRVWQSERACFT